MTTYEKVKKAATAQGLPIYKLEQAAGIGNGVIAGWQEGWPKVDTLKKVADALGLPLAELMGDT